MQNYNNFHNYFKNLLNQKLNSNSNHLLRGSLVIKKVYIPFYTKEKHMKNLVLIGYRGTGKTEVSKRLSKKLGMNAVNLDEEIVKKTGRSIPLFVKKYGWEAFRDVEVRVIKKFSRLKGIIIDTGGGVILREENIRNLRENGIMFLLTAGINTIKNRIKDDKDRPPLTDSKSATDEIEIVLKQREDKYNKAADNIIKTDYLSVEEVANRISKIFKD